MLALCIQSTSPFPYHVDFRGNRTELPSNVLFMAVCEHHLSRKLLLPRTFVLACVARAKNWWRWRGQTDRDGGWGEWSSISTRWWVYASSLPRGPEAMTSHPSPYALIHFTFISTSNDFAPMKGRERRLRHLLGEKWNLLPAMAIGCALGKRCEGIYSYYWGHAGQEQQSFSPSRVHTLLYAAGTQTDWHMPKRTHACT